MQNARLMCNKGAFLMICALCDVVETYALITVIIAATLSHNPFLVDNLNVEI